MTPIRSLAPALAASLLMVRALCPSAARAEVVRLPADVVPTFQAIHLNLDAAKPDYTGSVRIDLEVARSTRTIQFHAQEMTLTKVELRGKGGARKLEAQPGEDGLMTATAPGAIEPGRYTLQIEFSNEFDRRATSLYRLESGGEAYTFTQFEAVDARMAFPCWDEPSFKFPYQVTLSVPKAHEAVSNTPVERETVRDGIKTVVFRRTKPLPSYLLAIATGPLEYVPIPGMSTPGRVVVPKGSKALAEVAATMTPPILAALERYFGRPYPYEKLDLIAVPEYTYGAMENPGAVTYADRFLLFDPKTMSTAQKRLFAVFTAHELAHMWFGDLVTMKWWDDLWLNESFAEWMGDKIAGEVYPRLQVEVKALEELQGAMTLDARLSTRAIHQPVRTVSNLLQAADALTYKKGQATLSMFERWMGPEVFRRGVLAYLKKHEWGNAEADDLWDALSKAAGRDLKGPMATFLDQPGVPLVRAEILPAGRVRLTQRRFLNYGVAAPSPSRWQVPLTLKYSAGGTVRTHSILLSEESATVALPGLAGRSPEWVYPNAGGSGYYRWSIDSSPLAKLTESATRTLEPRERIGFVHNMRALVAAGEVRGEDFLRFVMSFADDPRPEVVGALPEALDAIKNVFVTEELEAPFAAYVRRVLGPSAERFGLDRVPGEEEAVSILRPELLGWLAEEGRDEEALARAERLARSFLADRGSIDPSLVSQVLRLAAIRGDAPLLEEYRRRFEAAAAPTDRMPLLAALGNFRDPKLRERALAYAIEGPLRPQEVLSIPQSMVKTIAYQDQVLTWMIENYDAMVGKVPPIYAIYLPYMGSGCTEARLQKTKAFFSMAEHSPPGCEVELARVIENVKDCIGVRAREGAAVGRYLTQLTLPK